TTSGCSGVSNTISVTVTPCGSVTISADGATEFCDGGSVTLTSSEASGNVWSTGETTQSIEVTGSGDYYVTNGNNTSNTISVVVNPLPVPVIAADGATEFCDGGSVGLNTEGTYESYLWSNGETGSGITAAQNGNYSVTVTDGNGCAGSSNTIHVTVNPDPVAEIFTDDPTTFCTHMSARLIASSNGSVQWYQDGEPVGGGLNYLRVGREGSYWVVSTLGACTTTSNSIDITLLGTWVSAQPKGPKNLCEADGETVILKANPGNPSASIRWRRDGSLIAGATGQYYTATKAGNYEAIASLEGCNTPSNTVVIKNVCKDGSAMSELMSDVTLYPNPSTDYVNISMQTAQSGQVLLRLYDASGRMVQSEKFGVSAGANSYELRFAGEQAGVFMVQLILPDGSVMNRTIIRVGK
ncbi:MAG: T9SS type A sorting domain-containing protein, partial [Chitinophagales bacterium]|nr:T9SS type A sorting domain-containing protein [Chitinophagales bacterium]